MEGDRLRLVRPVAAHREDRLGGAMVQAGQAQRRHVGEHGVAHEGVGEAETLPVGHEDSGDDRRVQRVEAAVGVALAGGHRSAQLEPLAEDGGDLQLGGGPLRQRRQPAADDITDGCWHLEVAVQPSLAGEPRELADEQRVATGAAANAVDDIRTRGGPRGQLDEVGDLLAVERGDPQPHGVGRGDVQPGQLRRQQRVGHQLGLAERGDDQHAAPRQPLDHEAEHVDGRPVGPVQVVEGDEHRVLVDVVEQVDERAGQLHR